MVTPLHTPIPFLFEEQVDLESEQFEDESDSEMMKRLYFGSPLKDKVR